MTIINIENNNTMDIITETQKWEAILASEGLFPIGEITPFEEDTDLLFMERADNLLQVKENMEEVSSKLEEDEYFFLKGFISTETGFDIFLKEVKNSLGIIQGITEV